MHSFGITPLQPLQDASQGISLLTRESSILTFNTSIINHWSFSQSPQPGCHRSVSKPKFGQPQHQLSKEHSQAPRPAFWLGLDGRKIGRIFFPNFDNKTENSVCQEHDRIVLKISSSSWFANYPSTIILFHPYPVWQLFWPHLSISLEEFPYSHFLERKWSSFFTLERLPVENLCLLV